MSDDRVIEFRKRGCRTGEPPGVEVPGVNVEKVRLAQQMLAQREMWACLCGCLTFRLMVDGSIECWQCQLVSQFRYFDPEQRA